MHAFADDFLVEMRGTARLLCAISLVSHARRECRLWKSSGMAYAETDQGGVASGEARGSHLPFVPPPIAHLLRGEEGMIATEMLKREHETIEKGLGLLELAAKIVRQGGTLPSGFQPWIAAFIKEFADGLHHAKEESLLFPMLEHRGIPREGGPIGCMLAEHDLGRRFARRIAQPLDGSGADPVEFANAAEGYVDLLRQHIFKENHVLFAMADHVLSPNEQSELAAAFARQDEGAPYRDQIEAEILGWMASLTDAQRQRAPIVS